jgi:hypothetical protein
MVTTSSGQGMGDAASVARLPPRIYAPIATNRPMLMTLWCTVGRSKICIHSCGKNHARHMSRERTCQRAPQMKLHQVCWLWPYEISKHEECICMNVLDETLPKKPQVSTCVYLVLRRERKKIARRVTFICLSVRMCPCIF